MIRILGGRAGSLWAQASRQLKTSYHAGKNVVLLVPEQYTLQAERDALSVLAVKGFFRLQVLSPSRLAAFVFDHAGRDKQALIDERGQAMTLARAMWTLREDLQYYTKARGKPGFTQKLVQAVSELKSAGLTPESLNEWLLEQPSKNPKLLDLAALYTAYEQTMAGQLADREDKDREMLSRLEGSSLFRHHDVIVYGFDLLTPPLIRLLSALAQRADNLLITLVMDRESAPDGKAFAPVAASAARLTRRLGELRLPWQWDSLQDDQAGRPDALYHLQQQMLRMKQQPFDGNPEGLRLFAGKTPHEEIRRAAQLIHAQLENGDDPRGIAIYLAQDSYAALLPGVLRDYGIPHFVSVKEPILAQPLVRCLLDALACVQTAAWRQQDVFSYLKSPFSPLSAEEAWKLENYARAFGIRGRKWTQPLTRGEPAAAEEMEALRQRAVTPILQMRGSLSKARNAGGSIDAVLVFLEEINARGRVSQLDEQLSSLNMQEEAQRERQVWDQLMGLFEQMNQLLGEERIPLGRFAEWLEAGLSMTKLAALPPLQHSVQAGLLGQLMIREPHSAYILGLNNDALNVHEETLIADRERTQLENGLDTQLNLQLQDLESIRLMDLWKAAATAGTRVHFSYALSDDQGKALSPLIELTRIKRMYPRLIEEGGAVSSLVEPRPFTPAVALDEIAVLLANGEIQGPWRTAWAWLNASPDWHKIAQAILRAARGDDPNKTLRPETAKTLHQAGAVSVSRLESYAGCPFRHFVDYGLKPQERKEWGLQATDLGNFCHAAIDSFTRVVKQDPAWPSMTKEKAVQTMDAVLGELTQGWEDAPWADTPRARQNANHAMNICRRMAWALTEGRAHSAFSPVKTELRFGLGDGLPPFAIMMEDGSSLSLRGTIDRLDTARTDTNQRLLRIIDYKSGSVELKGGDLDAGVQLQLMLYLKAALDLLEGGLPAGAFYQHMADPLVRAEDEAGAVKAARKKLRLDGVLLADARVIRLMDNSEPPVTLMEYVKKGGDLKDNGKLLSQEELNSLMDLAQQRTRELARSIFLGLISRSPLIRANGRAECRYCVYQGICRTEKISREPLRRHSRRISLKTLAQEGMNPP